MNGSINKAVKSQTAQNQRSKSFILSSLHFSIGKFLAFLKVASLSIKVSGVI